MSSNWSCDQVHADGVLEGYLAGRLSVDDERALEEHILTCRECAEAVALGMTVARALGRPQPGPGGRRLWRVAVPVTLAAAAAGLLLFGRGDTPGGLRELAVVRAAPEYTGVPVRSAAPADSLFDRGMRQYSSGEYRAASEALQRALDLGSEALPTRFFLGASQLMLDEAEAAEEEFGRVVALDDPIYSVEADFYRAKALLRLDRRDEAAAALERVAASDHPLASEAERLRGRLAELGGS